MAELTVLYGRDYVEFVEERGQPGLRSDKVVYLEDWR